MADTRVRPSPPVRFVGTNRRCIVRNRSSAVLLALAVLVLAPSFGMAQYAPKWHVGDWWVVKTWDWATVSNTPGWRYKRYEVTGIEKVRDRDCYVLETRRQGGPTGPISDRKDVFYVRVDDWLVVRRVSNEITGGTPTTHDYPRGLFGPFWNGELTLPRFPLRLGDPDTAFKLQRRDDYSAYLREISSVADTALVKRLLTAGDTLGTQAVQPSGVVYQVRDEMGGNLGPGPYPFPSEPLMTQSLQFWCENEPWRVYEEVVDSHGKTRNVSERSWLIATNHTGK
jgi:hypothetical protein